MTWTAVAYFGVAAIFAFIGVVAIDLFTELYPDHELYDDDLQCICHRSSNCHEHHDLTKD